MSSNTEIVAGNIMERAMDRQDDFLAPATKFIAGLREKGFKLYDVMAFLLTAAVDAPMAQPDFRSHGAELADALDGLAIALQTAADTIRSAENFIDEYERYGVP